MRDYERASYEVRPLVQLRPRVVNEYGLQQTGERPGMTRRSDDYDSTVTWSGGIAAVTLLLAGSSLILWLIAGLIFREERYIFGISFALNLSFLVPSAIVFFVTGSEQSKLAVAERQRLAAHQQKVDAEKAMQEVIERRDADKRALAIEIAKINAEAEEAVRSIRSLMESARGNLDIAEKQFHRRAFNPYWTAVEGAAQQLADVSVKLKSLKYLAEQHRGATKKLSADHHASAKRFFISRSGVESIDATSNMSSRLDSIVSKADTDFEFANIFNQRRTHMILIAGFSNLGSALAGLTAQLSTDLREVSSSITEAIRATHAPSIEAKNQRDEILQSLNNIQNRRMPPFGYSGDY